MELFAACQSLEDCAWKVLNIACEALQVQAGTLFQVDQENKTLEVVHTFGILPWRIKKSQFPFTQGICGWVAQHQEPAIVNDVAKDARFNGQIDLMTQFKTVSLLCMPLIRQGQLFGVLELINRQDHPFTDTDLETLKPILDSATRRFQELGT